MSATDNKTEETQNPAVNEARAEKPPAAEKPAAKKTAAKKKAVTKKKTAASKPAAKKTASKKPAQKKAKPAAVTAVVASPAAASEKTAAEKPAGTRKPAHVHPFIPYAIAATLIAFTAGLTLLLITLLDDTAKNVKQIKDASDSEQNTPALLAEARESFAQGDSRPATQPVRNEVEKAQPVSRITPVLVQDEAPVAEAMEAVVSEVDQPTTPVSAAPHSAEAQLQSVVSTHRRYIDNQRQQMLSQMDARRQQMQSQVVAQMEAMNRELSRIEDLMVPLDPQAAAHYREAVERRRENFQQMMEERARVLEEIRQQREGMRQRYTLLLDELRSAARQS